MSEPIIIPCEGSGWPTHALGTCSMCGQLVEAADDGRAARHVRQDVLAMLDRGEAPNV